MHSDIKRWTRSCSPCQLSKVTRHTVSPLSSFPVPDTWFDNIHVDIVDPLLPSHGWMYLLTYVDHFTRWPEAFSLKDISADSVARALVSGWIARFGIPSTITSDRGGQFQSSLWEQLTNMLGTTHYRTTTYHPQANGLVERFHRQLKGALKAQPPSQSWTDSLPLVLLGIFTAIKEDLHCTAAELVYGVTLRLPGEFFSHSSLHSSPDLSYIIRLKHCMSHLRATVPQPSSACPSFIDNSLNHAFHVFICRDSFKKPL